MIDPAVMVVIDSGRVAADHSEGVATADRDGLGMIDSAAVQQDAVTVARTQRQR